MPGQRRAEQVDLPEDNAQRNEPFAALFTHSAPPSPPMYGAVVARSTVPPAEKDAFSARASASWSAPTPEAPTVQPRGQSWMQLIMGIVAPTIYIALYCIFDIFAAKSSKDHGGYYAFEPACMVFIVEFGKLVVSLLVLMFWAQPELPTMRRTMTTARNFAPVACCFAVGNILMLVCLAKVSLANYGVWYQTSIFFNAFLWYIAFRRPFGIQRCLALVILAVGCVINSVQPGMSMHFDQAILWVVLSAFVAALGCVLNEYFMKEDFKLDLSIQNSILYFETCLACLVIIAIIHPSKLSSPYAFFQGFHGDCWIIAGVSIFIGLCVSWILKFANLITKTFAVAIHCPIEMVLAHYFIDVQITAFTVISALIIGVSIGVYSTAPKYETEGKSAAKDDCQA